MVVAFAATILIAYLPYLGVGPMGVLGSLPGYASERGMVSGEQFFLLAVARKVLNAQVPVAMYGIFVIAVLGAISVWLLRDRRNDDLGYLRDGLMIASVFMLLLAPHFSWYFAWLVVFLCFVPSLAVLYLTLASFVLYLTWLGDAPDRVLLLKSLIFAPAVILGAIRLWVRRNE